MKDLVQIVPFDILTMFSSRFLRFAVVEWAAAGGEGL
jgi:hypothetical protein